MILHITNDYSGSTVYKNLIRELDKLGVNQIVYNPIKERTRIGKNKIDFQCKDSNIIYSHILNKIKDRLFYRKKIRKIVKDIESKVDLSKITFIHAHTWYSDGGVAYELHKKYNIPYIIAVRTTDINIHYKYFLFQRYYGFKILENSRKIILIGESQKLFFNEYKFINNSIFHKLQVIPNGVDSFWLNNLVHFVPNLKASEINVLYVGSFIKRKKLFELQKAIININKEGNYKIKLHIVGGNGSSAKRVLKNVELYPSLFKYYGIIKDKNELKEIFNECQIFSMPSRNETFGLVYIEALLQGLPILYTENDGIDGYYDEYIGEKVSKQADELEIKQTILKLVENYNNFEIPTQKLFNNHNWTFITDQYVKIYKK